MPPRVARNDLAALRRKPSDLRRYMAWTSDIKTSYGSITNYICQRRLHWTSASSQDIAQIKYNNPIPFEDASDYRVLRNDWPYGLTADIKHIVVWSKTPIATKPENGDVTDESRALIEAFVDRSFVRRLLREPAFAALGKEKIREQNILWFKNWTALQSVRSLEHFHVLVRGIPDEIITEWTHDKAVVQDGPLLI